MNYEKQIQTNFRCEADGFVVNERQKTKESFCRVKNARMLAYTWILLTRILPGNFLMLYNAEFQAENYSE